MSDADNNYPMSCAICEKLGKPPEVVHDEHDYFVHVYICHPIHHAGILAGKTFDEVQAEIEASDESK